LRQIHYQLLRLLTLFRFNAGNVEAHEQKLFLKDVRSSVAVEAELEPDGLTWPDNIEVRPRSGRVICKQSRSANGCKARERW
jgi:hypothetical protein